MQTCEFRDNAGQYSFLSGSAKLAVSQQYSVAFGDEIIAARNKCKQMNLGIAQVNIHSPQPASHLCPTAIHQ